MYNKKHEIPNKESCSSKSFFKDSDIICCENVSEYFTWSYDFVNYIKEKNWVSPSLVEQVKRADEEKPIDFLCFVQHFCPDLRIASKGRNNSYQCYSIFREEENPSMTIYVNTLEVKDHGGGSYSKGYLQFVFLYCYRKDKSQYPNAVADTARALGIPVIERSSKSIPSSKSSSSNSNISISKDIPSSVKEPATKITSCPISKEKLISFKKNLEKTKAHLAEENNPCMKYLEKERMLLNHDIWKEYELGYSKKRKKLIFPIYDDKTGEPTGCQMREIGNVSKGNRYRCRGSKGGNVWGLLQAKEPIRKEDYVIIVEGMMDALSLRHLGFIPTVALMGSQATKEQIERILSYTQNILLMLDWDESGKQRQEEVKEAFLQKGAKKVTTIDFSVAYKQTKDMGEVYHLLVKDRTEAHKRIRNGTPPKEYANYFRGIARSTITPPYTMDEIVIE